MLEKVRKQGASAFIWIVFAILIGMFVINFGQQQAGSQGGCNFGSGKRTALKVGGSEIDDAGWRLSLNLGQALDQRRGIDNYQLIRTGMERLIVRELLAGEAERRGLRVPEGLVDEVMHDGKIHFGFQVANAESFFKYVDKDADEEQVDPDPGPTTCTKDVECKGDRLCKSGRCKFVFDYGRFERILRSWNISIGAYKREQAREILASTMARILIHEAPASKDEALSTYIAENTKVSFNSVEFDANEYADALLITDRDLDRFIKGHNAEVNAAYNAEAWKGKKQVHLRRIFVEKAPLPPAPNPPAQPVDGGNGPAPVPPPPPDPGKAKLAALREAIASGKRGFVEVAETTETNKQMAARGGDLGWYDEGVFTLNDPALNDAAAKLVQGKVSDVIEGADGFYILLIDDRREGDLTVDKVQRELALPLARAQWGKEAARRAAIAAVKEAVAKGKHLGELFPAAKTGMAPAGPVEIISDRPVVWGQAGEGSAAPTAPAGGSPTTGAPAPTPAGPPPIMEPSIEQLPAMAPVDPPTIERHDGVVRAGDATPLGESADLARALFDQLEPGKVADRIFEVRGSVVDPMPQYVVVQVTGKELADVAAFDKQAEKLVDRLATYRGYQLFQEWLQDRCTVLAKDGKIKPSRMYLPTKDEDGKPLEPYTPCESVAAR